MLTRTVGQAHGTGGNATAAARLENSMNDTTWPLTPDPQDSPLEEFIDVGEDTVRRMMPKQKPGKSKQDYGTPRPLLAAIERRLKSEFIWDLAASDENHVAPCYYTEEDNALVQPWAEEINLDWAFLNPPFADIDPWVEKSYKESLKGANIIMLVPSSFADWWVKWVEDKAYVVHLNKRITFVGETKPYPKDCSLLIYTPFGFKGSEVWTWR